MSCGKHACVQHPNCRVVTEQCWCPECRLALAVPAHEPAPGDIVALHSGGPDLTVLRVYDDPSPPLRPAPRVADLGWFTAAGEYRTGTLPLAVLRSGDSVEPAAPTVHAVAPPRIRALRPPGGR